MAKQTINIADKETLDAIKDKVFNGGKSIYFSGFNDEGLVEDVEKTPLGLDIGYSDTTATDTLLTPISYRNKLYIFGVDKGLNYCVLDEDKNVFVRYPSPYNFIPGAVVVFNDEIHIFGNNGSGCYTFHYKFDGNKWHMISQNTPFYGRDSCTAVVYNNRIHILGCRTSGESGNTTVHYSWTEDEGYVRKTDLPLSTGLVPSIVSFNNTIYLFYNTGSSYWYQWTGSSWTQLSNTPPYMSDGRYHAVVHNNELYYCYAPWYLYKLTGTTWTLISYTNHTGSSNVSNRCFSFNGKLYFYHVTSLSLAVVDNNAIYTISSSSLECNSQFAPDRLIEFKNALYLFGNSTHYDSGNSNVYKYENGKWLSASSVPYSKGYTKFVSTENNVHMIGGYQNGKAHYIYDGSTWTQSVNTPIFMLDSMSRAIRYKNEVHIFGYTNDSSSSDRHKNHYHYKFDGEKWVYMSKLPEKRYLKPFVVDDELYITGDSNLTYKFNDTDCCWYSIDSEISDNNEYSTILVTDLIHVFRNGRLDSSYKIEHTVYNKKFELVKSYGEMPYNQTSTNIALINGEIYVHYKSKIYKIADKFYHVYNAKLPAGIHIMFEDDTVVEPLDNCSLEDDGSLLTTATGLVRFRIMGRDDLPQYTIY